MKKNEMNSNSIPSLGRVELEQQVRQRADEDPAFRQALKANPRAALERDFGEWFPGGKVPAGKTITVTEEDEQTIHLVLLSGSSAISEELLESVQGGAGSLTALADKVKGGLANLEDDRTKYDCGASTRLWCSDGNPPAHTGRC